MRIRTSKAHIDTLKGKPRACTYTQRDQYFYGKRKFGIHFAERNIYLVLCLILNLTHVLKYYLIDIITICLINHPDSAKLKSILNGEQILRVLLINKKQLSVSRHINCVSP